MKKTLLVFAMALVAFGLSAQEKNFLDVNYVEVTGRADMEVTPDEIYLSIIISEGDGNRKTMAQREQEMMRALRDAGIDLEKDMTVGDMTSDLKSYVLRKNTVQATKTYELKVNGATQLSNVFNVLSQQGVTDANVSRVDVSNIEELRDQVRAMSVKAAQKNAATLAEAVGQSIGRAIYIQDYGYTARPFANVMMARGVVADEVAVSLDVPELEFQKVTLEYSVTARFLLE